MTPQSIKTLLTNSPQISQIMEVTKCFAAFIDISKDLLCYTAQPEPTACDQKCNHILQSDMEETVVDKSTIPFGFLKVKRTKGKWTKINNHLFLVLLNSVKMSCKILQQIQMIRNWYMNMEIQISQERKSVITTHEIHQWHVWKCVGVGIIMNGNVLGFSLWWLVSQFPINMCGDNRLPFLGNLYFHIHISISDHLNLL